MSSVWNHRSPRIYRYLDKEYADQFFEAGMIRLSSFVQFSKHADEQRLDSTEGKTYLVHRTTDGTGQTLIVEADFGHDAYVLCASLVPSLDLMHEFGCSSGIIIKDVQGFASAVSKAVPGFRLGVDGPCSYQYRRIIEHDFGWLELGPSEQTDDIAKFNPEILNQTLTQMVSADVYFLKHPKYAGQAEWRLIWLTDRAIDESIIVECPAAVEYCERWEKQGEVVAYGQGRA